MDPESLQRALAAFPLDDEHPWQLVVDLERVTARYLELVSAFPGAWQHAIAIKAHPLVETLRSLVELGASLEAASMGEVGIAQRAGCDPSRVVFDSPVKTRAELAATVGAGVLINADNLVEVERIAELRPSGRVGLRLNPEVEFGRVSDLSVGVPDSKFGVSLTTELDAVHRAFEQHSFLDGVHVHVGSYGYDVDLLAAGVRRVLDVGQTVGARRIDIGGGMPPGVAAADYASVLRVVAPELFDGSVQVVTEFGRWMFHDCAAAVSRVEYVKPSANGTIATIHFGGDLLLRRIYRPDIWKHPIDVYAADGKPHRGVVGPLTIGGPLCFGGDVITRGSSLPIPAAGDLVVVSEIGAYTFGMWSKYCSRPFPRVVGLKPEPVALHPGQTTEEVVAGW